MLFNGTSAAKKLIKDNNKDGNEEEYKLLTVNSFFGGKNAYRTKVCW